MTSFKFIVTILTCLIIFTCSCSTKQNNSKVIDTSKSTSVIQTDTLLNGLYAGLEEMCWVDSNGKKDCYNDPSRPERKWYHLGYLKIKGDSVFLDQNPISIGPKNDTLWSSSDGAFYYYSGTFKKVNTTVLFNLKELFCDYCAIPEKQKPDGSYEVIKRTKQWKGILTNKGILIDNNLYLKTTQSEIMVSEHPEPYLKSQ